jgi:hypothetical protein
MTSARRLKSPDTRPGGLAPWLISGILIVITLLAFWPAVHCDFINMDDGVYVGRAGCAQMGLNYESITWALTHRVLDLYHPVSPISLMFDYELFGHDPGGYHAVNILIHLLNVLILFWLLTLTTVAPWRSGIVAAIFAVHPLRVESVVWIAERKDLLMLFFGLLALAAYTFYARQPSIRRYLPIPMLLVLSLLSKPTLLTFPLLVCLWDYWPLRRWESNQKPSLKLLLAEKIPLLLVAGVVALAVPSWQADAGNAGKESELLATGPRLANAVVSVPRYIGKMIDFRDLVIWYPYIPWSPPAVIASILCIAAITALTLLLIRRAPWLAIGWFFYLFSLLPVIGIVYINGYSIADRYTYVPMIGLLMAVAWSIPETWMKRREGMIAVSTVMAGYILVLIIAVRAQIPHWHDSASIWTHAVDRTANNWNAILELGILHLDDGRNDDALACFNKVCQLAPHLSEAPHGPASAISGALWKTIPPP